jgi:EAL domain-containing protein (putative c-di-GMP-specific phosphodiesterase class I)
VHRIDEDPVRQSLAAAVVGFANQTGSIVVSEGIETAAEMSTLRGLNVHHGQGFFIGRPTADVLSEGVYAHVVS